MWSIISTVYDVVFHPEWYLIQAAWVVNKVSHGNISPRTAYVDLKAVYWCLYILAALRLLPILKAWFVRRWYGEWFFNEETGEWHQIKDRDKKGVIYDNRGYNKRSVIESFHRKARRDEIKMHVVIVPLAVWYLYDLFFRHPSFILWVIGPSKLAFFGVYALAFFVGFFGLSCALALLSLVPNELLYLSGAQWIDGAKVRDPATQPRPGPETLKGRDDLGKAKPADDNEAGDFLDGKGKGETKTRWPV